MLTSQFSFSPDQLRTPDQVAHETGLSVRMVRYRLYRGEIDAVSVGRGNAKRWFIPVEEVDRLRKVASDD